MYLARISGNLVENWDPAGENWHPDEEFVGKLRSSIKEKLVSGQNFREFGENWDPAGENWHPDEEFVGKLRSSKRKTRIWPEKLRFTKKLIYLVVKKWGNFYRFQYYKI